MRLYVTGSMGFVGQWVRRQIAAQREPWVGVSLAEEPGVDIRDTGALADSLARLRPDAVLHLAAQSNVPDAIADPGATAEVNVMGTMSVLQAIERAAPQARLLQVGSGDAYGLVSEDRLPVSEDQPFAPRNPYAASKAAAEMFVLERARRGRVHACCARSFNHTGPGQDERFVFPAIARQAAAVRRRGGGRIVVGDLEITRDFLDVRDVVDAYLCLLQRGASGCAYNVCSGIETPLRPAAEAMVSGAGVVPDFVRDAELLRLAEQRRMVGDSSRLRALGWAPRISLETTLRDVMNDWLSRPAPETN